MGATKGIAEKVIKKPPFSVAKGAAITTKRGILSNGDEIKAANTKKATKKVKTPKKAKKVVTPPAVKMEEAEEVIEDAEEIIDFNNMDYDLSAAKDILIEEDIDTDDITFEL